MSILNAATEQFAQAGITLVIQKKPVKNINFRLKANALHVCAPYGITDSYLGAAILSRQDWAIAHHQKQLNTSSIATPTITTLWGEPYTFKDRAEQLTLYRHALTQAIPDLCQKWQPIVGKTAKQIRIKKMISRFGTCNHTQARIWLSVYLAAFDYRCTEYVFVHELCHLHHANHSKAFWQAVQSAMPDYLNWHNHLKQQNLRQVGL